LKIIGRLAEALDVEPAELLKMPGKQDRMRPGPEGFTKHFHKELSIHAGMPAVESASVPSCRSYVVHRSGIR
jgi:hypothetical protein